MRKTALSWAFLAGFLAASRGWCDVQVKVDVNRGDEATAEFKFDDVPSPSATDAANEATLRIVAGDADSNGAELRCLYDGRLPAGNDEPDDNFFFAAGSEGGRLLIDLGKAVDVKQINAYSWHRDTRGPQVYKIYAHEDAGDGVRFRGVRRGDPAERGWKLLAEVDTRSESEEPGGQYGVSISDSEGGTLVSARYLLLVIEATETDDPFGNTFFSEIDVVDGQEHAPAPEPPPVVVEVLEVEGGVQIEFDVSQTPDLKPWVDGTLKPTCAEWYPKIVAMLPSSDYEAPRRFRITFHADMDGVAYCAGTSINCAARWFRDNLEGEAPGAVVHEMVHVVQQYGRARGGERNPGWMVEGLADYIRWFLYEPEDKRTKPNPDRAKYTDSYRITAAFLDYIVREHDAACIEKFNAAMRNGEYSETLWQEYTGKSIDELWANYVETLRES
jgi:hypothetical protein